MDETPTLLAVLVGRIESSNAEIVAGYHACARANGEDAAITVRTLRRWMAGQVRTSARPAQRRVASLYWGYPMSRLLAPARFEELAEVERLVIASPSVSGSITNRHQRTQPLGDGHTIERQMAMSTRRAAKFTSYAEATNVGPETIDQIRDETARLANAYIREPLSDIISDLIELQDDVFAILEGKQRPTQSGDLYLFAGVVSGMLAKASHDLGRPRDAMTQARTMFVCAESAGHLPLQSWARGLQSLIAYWAGRHEEAVRYASNGAALLGDHAGTVAAWLPALEARAHAQLGRAPDARSAIQRAADIREGVTFDDLDNVGGLFTFPEAKQHYYAAGAYVGLDGADTEAEAQATTALDLFEAGEYRSFSDEAGARAELALARVHNRDVDGAKAALADMLALEPSRRIGGILPSAFRVHAALREPQFTASPVARNLREEIEAFCRTPAAALTA